MGHQITLFFRDCRKLVIYTIIRTIDLRLLASDLYATDFLTLNFTFRVIAFKSGALHMTINYHRSAAVFWHAVVMMMIPRPFSRKVLAYLCHVTLNLSIHLSASQGSYFYFLQVYLPFYLMPFEPSLRQSSSIKYTNVALKWPVLSKMNVIVCIWFAFKWWPIPVPFLMLVVRE